MAARFGPTLRSTLRSTWQRRLRPEGIEFVQLAPRVLSFEAEIAASPAATFAVLADAPSWARWFPCLRHAIHRGPPPYGVGTARESRVLGATFTEMLVAFDEDARYAWRVDTASIPLAHALVEDWRVCPAPDRPDRTHLTWTFAIDPTVWFGALLPVAPVVMGAVFQRAARGLEHLAAAPASGEAHVGEAPLG